VNREPCVDLVLGQRPGATPCVVAAPARAGASAPIALTPTIIAPPPLTNALRENSLLAIAFSSVRMTGRLRPPRLPTTI
jgi:hypothetical protein